MHCEIPSKIPPEHAQYIVNKEIFFKKCNAVAEFATCKSRNGSKGKKLIRAPCHQMFRFNRITNTKTFFN